MKGIILIVFVGLLLGSCGEDYIAEYCPANDGDDWVSDLVRKIRKSDQDGHIYYYEYDGQPVFAVDTCVGCADAMTIVYNCDKGVVCQFGGIAGLNTCPDWVDKATNEKLIYKNY